MPRMRFFSCAFALAALSLSGLSGLGSTTAAAQPGARRLPPLVRARRTIADLAAGVDGFKKDVGSYPKTLDETIRPARGTRHWHGPYYFGPSVPLDPWGHPYIYTVPGKQSGKGYDLLSYGPDGEPGGGDDIVNGSDPQ